MPRPAGCGRRGCVESGARPRRAASSPGRRRPARAARVQGKIDLRGSAGSRTCAPGTSSNRAAEHFASRCRGSPSRGVVRLLTCSTTRWHNHPRCHRLNAMTAPLALRAPCAICRRGRLESVLAVPLARSRASSIEPRSDARLHGADSQQSWARRRSELMLPLLRDQAVPRSRSGPRPASARISCRDAQGRLAGHQGAAVVAGDGTSNVRSVMAHRPDALVDLGLPRCRWLQSRGGSADLHRIADVHPGAGAPGQRWAAAAGSSRETRFRPAGRARRRRRLHLSTAFPIRADRPASSRCSERARRPRPRLRRAPAPARPRHRLRHEGRADFRGAVAAGAHRPAPSIPRAGAFIASSSPNATAASSSPAAQRGARRTRDERESCRNRRHRRRADRGQGVSW